jgi:NTE family protein
MEIGELDTVGVALGSGGASSVAQLGALEALLEAGLPIDVVAGTSAGAIVGAVLATGRLEAFRDALSAFTLRRVFGLFNLVWARGALLELGPALEFVRPFVAERIEDLDKPYAAVAADLESGDEVVIRSGTVLDAVRASCAIPGVFPPYRTGARWLTDGAIANPVPVSVARELGARFVIALNVLFVDQEQADRFAREIRPSRSGLLDRLTARLSPPPLAAEPQGERAEVEAGAPGMRVFGVVAQASRIVQCRIAAARLRHEPPDVLVNIPAADVGVFDFHRAADLIVRGREAARAALPEIERALAARLPAHRRLRRWWRARQATTPPAELVAPEAVTPDAATPAAE